VIFGQDRSELRRMYAEAWRKHCDGLPLSPLESGIARVVAEHPEYRDAVVGDPGREFPVGGGATNPFLHMGLHLAIREQVGTDRPAGIARGFRTLRDSLGDPHAAEHRMIDCLAETLWEAQGRNAVPDEAAYLERLRRL
jgi:hypothetical protein